MLETGNKILVAHRRLFSKDEPRYFIGEVTDYDQGISKLSGYSFVRDAMTGNFIRKNDRRTKIVSIHSGAFLFYLLPDATDLEALRFHINGAELLLSDGSTLSMNMTEQPHRGEI
jgi:hypothetical protein